MSKHTLKLPERTRGRAVRKIDSDAVDVLAPASSAHPFVSFRYSFTQMSLLGGKAHVKSRNASFDDGKLTSEAFEGELDRSAYDRAVREAQRHIGDQTAQFLKSLSIFLPFFRTRGPDRE